MSFFSCPGARSNAAGALPAGSLASSSVMPFTVTFPVFLTVTVYVISSSTAAPVVFDAVFVTVSTGAPSSVVTFADAVPITSAPLGFLPVTVAVLLISPASTSPCVTTYVAVAVAVSPGAMLVTSSVPISTPSSASATVRPFIVTFPLRASAILFGFAALSSSVSP